MLTMKLPMGMGRTLVLKDYGKPQSLKQGFWSKYGHCIVKISVEKIINKRGQKPQGYLKCASVKFIINFGLTL